MIRGRRGRPPSSNPQVPKVTTAPPRNSSIAVDVEDKEPPMLLHPTSYQNEALEGTDETNDIIINKRSRSKRTACIDQRDKYSPFVGAFNLMALSLSPSSQVFADEVKKFIPFKRSITTYMEAEEGGNENELSKRKASLELTEDEEVEAQGIDAKTNTTEDETGKKKRKGGRKKGNKMLQGSRCTRVNGRGWRCSQITLVGYSLCQHHLGMARIRTMSSLAAGDQNSKTRGVETRGSIKNNNKNKAK